MRYMLLVLKGSALHDMFPCVSTSLDGCHFLRSVRSSHAKLFQGELLSTEDIVMLNNKAYSCDGCKYNVHYLNERRYPAGVEGQHLLIHIYRTS